MSSAGDELSRLAETFNDMMRRLELSFEAEKRFVSDASHELRTPTAVILAQCDEALRGERPAEEYRDALAVVRRQGRRMSRIVSDMLTLTRMERGADVFEAAPVDLSALTDELCRDMALIADKGISLAFEIEPGVTVDGDAARLSRMLSNLIGNAYRYGRENGRIRVTLKRDADEAVLTVADDGVGIAPENLENIFERFFRCAPDRSDGGTGLGLPIARQIARAHGGDIAVQSEPGRGSAFTALLALALFCAAQAAVDRAGAQALALKAAGVAEADVRRLSVETETRGGRTVYDVEFRFGGFEYEYWISAEDGAIVKDSWELDPEKTLEMAREQGSGAIDEARALSAALTDAGVAAEAVVSSKVERDAEGGLRLYEVSFCTADAEYEYDIDAATGAVCGVSVERFSQDEAARPGQTLPAAALSREDARRAALADAGLTEAQATVTKLKLDYEDGVRVYEIEFVTDDAEYEYEIDASTGAIREKSVESRGKTRQDSASYIGVDRAKRIALSRAGLSAGDVSFTKAKLEKDDGVRVYEIEFRAGGTEYEFEIDAVTGRVLESSVETKTPETPAHDDRRDWDDDDDDDDRDDRDDDDDDDDDDWDDDDD